MLNLDVIKAQLAQECAVDRVQDDVTVRLLGRSASDPAVGIINTRQEGVFSGEAVCHAFASLYEKQVKLELLVKEAAPLTPGTRILRMHASVGECLSLERTLLNYLCHLSGIASLTKKFVDAVRPHPVKILATRKTLPGLRDLQLQAVVAGGGHIHRRSLSDGILIKENHQEFVSSAELLKTAKSERSPLHRIEIEVQDLNLLPAIIEKAPDIIMLDNLGVDAMRGAIASIREKLKNCAIEVSGGMNLSTVKAVAELGVDYISVGQLTHSAPSLNLGMDIERAV